MMTEAAMVQSSGLLIETGLWYASHYLLIPAQLMFDDSSPNARESGLPVVALRSLAIQASIDSTKAPARLQIERAAYPTSNILVGQRKPCRLDVALYVEALNRQATEDPPQQWFARPTHKFVNSPGW
jgi:hypothetical protein